MQHTATFVTVWTMHGIPINYPESDTPLRDPVLQLWLLRMLVQLDVERQWLQERHWCEKPYAKALGLDALAAQNPNPQTMLAALTQLHRQAEQRLSRWRHKGVLHSNLALLTSLVGLTRTDQLILEFTICLHSHPFLAKVAEKIGPFKHDRMLRALSCVLALPLPEVRRALASKGLLVRTGLIKLSSFGSDLTDRLEPLNAEFCELMVSGPATPMQILKGMVALAPEPQLQLSDYPHLRSSLDVLLPYLSACLQARSKGVNVLLYGPPGTGKTQLTRVLAQQLHVPMYEVSSEDDDGDPINGLDRLSAYRAAQSFFHQSRCLLVFDEIEDVFQDSPFSFRRSTGQACKAWVNRCLESNPAPALWLCNSIAQLDSAYLRRFDMVLELPIPPQTQRLAIAQQACGHLIDTPGLVRLASAPSLSPAVIARASKVMDTVGNHLSSIAKQAALERLVNQTLQAQGHPPVLRHNPNRLPEVYDPAFIHADTDLQVLAQGLQRAPQARLCLFGPPGTGKTAYARWVAEQLERPLRVQRASDLISRWVGGTEANIAKAFRAAEADNAVLLMDEVDSFLQERSHAQRSWEVTQVNEMLTQMEGFAGVFFASTNLMGQLDTAALRRFDLKIQFDYLRPAQAWQLLQRCCAQLQLPAPDAAAQQQLQRLRCLTPGDFATVMRQQRFRPVAAPQQLINALQTEYSLKPAAGQAMGFV